MEWSNNEKQSQGDKSPKPETNQGLCGGGRGSPGTSVYITVSENGLNVSLENLPSPNALDMHLSPGISPSLSDGWTQDFSCDYVKKSRTHDCVMEFRPDSSVSPENRDQAWTQATGHHSRLVNSASFPGFGATPRLLHENQYTSANNREMIDYRNLTPQVPFVPSIAKSIPKKRIFLRKPKKAIKDLFVHKTNTREKSMSSCTPCQEYGPTTKHTRKSSRWRESRTSRRMNDTLSDSSSEGCASVYEDAVSLKSFGSQAGCGEIFADEEYLVSIEGTPILKTSRDTGENPNRSPVALQGGMEQLVSPAHPEVSDLLGMWESINRTILFSQNSSQGTNTASTPISVSPSSDKITYPIESITEQKNNLNHTVTMKSENRESTSDEGYCDCISTEDHTGQSLTPVFSRKFPRDTYSGDALYELFYDPSEAEMTPIYDDEMDLPSNVIGQPSPDLPLSMYSFHIGSEENLAPPLSVDLISHDFLQSNWVGKDCLLKLCDTEISMAMGIVNWMKHRTIKGNRVELGTPAISMSNYGQEEPASRPACQEEQVQNTDIGHVQSEAVLMTAHCTDNISDLKVSKPCQGNVHFLVDTAKHQAGVVTTPESQPRTPTSHIYFRIFNINSPSTPNMDFESPIGRSPGSGMGSLFVLAINKESLCESCKGSLKHGAKELHLCHSCTSFIEQIKMSELWPHANLYQAKLAGTPQALLPSPSSSCGIASDISIRSLVEQCANQMSMLKLNQHQHSSDHKMRVVTNQGSDNCPRKDHTRKLVKSKPKKKVNVTGNEGDNANVKQSFSHVACSPSLQQMKRHDLNKTNGSDCLVMKTKKSPCYLQMNPSKDTKLASRPTSLPLTTATSCRFSKKEHHTAIKVKEKPGERVQQDRQDRRPAVSSDGLSASFTSQDKKKLEQRSRMKR